MVRWVEAVALFGVVLTIRLWLGRFYGGMPTLSFYPAVLIAAIFLGGREAIFILVMAIAVAWFLYASPEISGHECAFDLRPRSTATSPAD